MSKETLYDQIDRYLQGQLEEDHPFVQSLKQDPALMLEVETQKLVSEAVIDYRLIQVENIVEGYRSEAINPKKSYTKWLMWLIPAASVGVLGYFFLNHESSKVVLKRTAVTLAPIVDQKDSTSSKVAVVLNEKKAAIVPVEKKEMIVSASTSASSTVPNNQVALPTNTLPQAEIKISTAPSHDIAIVSAQKNQVETLESKVIDLCATTHLKAFVHETKPCKGTHEGILRIENVKGGKAPYHFSIDHGKTFQSSNSFPALASGYYSIVVKDGNGCEDNIYPNYTLDSKTCINFAQYSINPHLETWEVPTEADKAGELQIVEKTGKQVFIRKFASNEKMTWDGTSLNGQLLISGMYVYTIQYVDGTIERGNITLAY